MSQSESFGVNLKPWPKLLDHYKILIFKFCIFLIFGVVCSVSFILLQGKNNSMPKKLSMGHTLITDQQIFVGNNLKSKIIINKNDRGDIVDITIEPVGIK